MKTQTYTIVVTTNDDGTKANMKRTNDGFETLDLLGMVTLIQSELIDVLHGKRLDINYIERNVIVDTKHKQEVFQYSIWCEGRKTESKLIKASCLGHGIGVTFNDAVKDFMITHDNYEFYKINGIWYYDICALFDNEADARKSHG